MKTKAFSRIIYVFIAVMVSSLWVNASNPKSYVYDTKEDNGKITSKVIFLQEEGLLNKEFRYEFAYNNEGKVAEKTAYRWSKTLSEWEPFYKISYQYNNSDEIHTNYVMWDKKKKDFILNEQQMVMPATSYDEIFS